MLTFYTKVFEKIFALGNLAKFPFMLSVWFVYYMNIRRKKMYGLLYFSNPLYLYFNCIFELLNSERIILKTSHSKNGSINFLVFLGFHVYLYTIYYVYIYVCIYKYIIYIAAMLFINFLTHIELFQWLTFFPSLHTIPLWLH